MLLIVTSFEESCFSDSRNERTLLDPLLSEDAFIMPCKGILRLCAMSLPVSPSYIHLFCFSLSPIIFTWASSF